MVLARQSISLLRIMRWLLIRTVALLLLINGVLYLQQPSMTFYPSSELVTTPSQWGMPYEEVEFASADKKKLHGWFIPHPTATYTMLFFHGNGGNISHRGDSVAIFHRLGLNVLLVDYRGYGRSEGRPNEAGLYRDATAAWQYLRQQKQVKPENIILFGRSMGGAVATELAARTRPGGLILESSFSSATDMARKLFPLLSRITLLRYHFDSVSRIKQVKSPIMVLHSPQDEIIPYELGRRLYAAAPGVKQFVELRGDHNSGFLQSQPHYEQKLAQFINELIVNRVNYPD